MTTGSVQTLLLPAVFFRVVPETPGYICSMRRFGVTRNLLLHIATTATTWAVSAPLAEALGDSLLPKQE